MTAWMDITGVRFGRLVATAYLGKSKWECLCDCGETRSVWLCSLRRGSTQSCGCYGRERARIANTTHGARGDRTYSVWANMLRRCRATSGKDAAVYSQRGIAVCKRWLRFENFLKDMGHAPPGMSIDRINGRKGYSPSNCRWATPQQQAHNSRVTKLSDADVIAIRADERPYKEIAATYGISTGHVCKVRSGKFYRRLI